MQWPSEKGQNDNSGLQKTTVARIPLKTRRNSVGDNLSL